MAYQLLDNFHSASDEEVIDHSQTLFSLTIEQLKLHPYYGELLKNFPQGQTFFTSDTPQLTGLKLAELTRENPLAMFSQAQGPSITIGTGGSTGKRKTITHSFDFFQRMIHLGVRAVEESCLQRPKSVANCFAAGDLFGAFKFGEGICEQLGVHYFPLGSANDADSLGEIIADFSIDTLFCTPSFAYSLVHRIRDLNQLRSLKSIYYVGELMRQDDAVAIQQKLDVDIRSLSYTSSELGPMGYQCQHCAHDTYHLNEDAVYLEIVDPDTKETLVNGQKGEIVVTTYLNKGTPFLRYNTGDLGIIYDAKCDCGSSRKRVQLFGRNHASINICTLSLEKSFLVDVLSQIQGLQERDIQVVVTGDNLDIELEIILNEEKVEPNHLIMAKEALQKNYVFNKIMSSKAVIRFDVIRLKRSDFYTTAMNKTPFFIKK